MQETLSRLDTEQKNPRTARIDTMSTLEMASLINEEDHLCAEAVKRTLPEIARAVDVISACLERGGRLFYCGAGTSGRLGVLDAAECPPTFGVEPGLVVALIAGGRDALLSAAEGAEDHPEDGKRDLTAHGFTEKDALVGIAASGRTPYVIGAMDCARSLGAPVMALVCCRDSEMARHADIVMCALPGPEVIAGSTRMKSGTCQKMILNILSTCVMIRRGKVFGNLMVDVKASNEKLVQRAVRIVAEATGESEEAARSALTLCGFSCKTAIVTLLTGLSPAAARQALDAADGRVAAALEKARSLT